MYFGVEDVIFSLMILMGILDPEISGAARERLLKRRGKDFPIFHHEPPQLRCSRRRQVELLLKDGTLSEGKGQTSKL